MRHGIYFGLGFLLAVLTLTGAAAAPSRIETMDGSVIVGEIVSNGAGVYHVRTGFGDITIPAAKVRTIRALGDVSGTATPPNAVPGADSDLVIQGSNTIGAQLMPALLEAYFGHDGKAQLEWVQGTSEEERTLDVKAEDGQTLRIQLNSHGSKTAFEGLLAKAIDIGAASRPVTDNEVADAERSGIGDLRSPSSEHVLALDGLVVIVNRENPISALSLEDIGKVFAGEITDWSALGGAPGPIDVYARDDKSGTFDTFKSLVLGNREVRAQKRFDSNPELSDTVAADRQGIGFTGFAYVRNAKPLSLRTRCGDVLGAEEFTVKTEEYPLSRRLFLYTPLEQRRQIAGDMLEYALSPNVQKIVADNGFINLEIEISGEGYAPDRLASALAITQPGIDPGSQSNALYRQFAARTRGARRLSVTFRFRSGAADLDSRALRDLDRLAAYVRGPEIGGRRLMLLGFADPRGSLASNLALSRSRAERVAAVLQQKQVTIGEVIGFGPLFPVACNADDVGMAKNRRVEVWVD